MSILFFLKNNNITLADSERVDIDQFNEAIRYLNETKLVYNTPLIEVNTDSLDFGSANCNVFLKLENMQNTGNTFR